MLAFKGKFTIKNLIFVLFFQLTIQVFGQVSTDTNVRKTNGFIKSDLQSKFGPKPNYISFNSDSAKSITLPSGTTLEINAGSFVKSDGTPVKGLIQLKYTEYQTPADFIGSGIRMSDINGEQGTFFQSSGMFEILGNQSGEPIQIKKNEAIKVHFKSLDNPDNLKLYAYDSIANKWTTSAVLKQQGAFPTADIVDLKSTLVKPNDIRVADDFIDALKFLKSTNNSHILTKYVELYEKRDANLVTTQKWTEELQKKKYYKKYQISVWDKGPEKAVIYIGEAVAGPAKKLTLENLNHIAKKGTELESNMAFKDQGELAFLWEFDPRYVQKYSANTLTISWDSCRFVEKEGGMQILFKTKTLSLIIPLAKPCLLQKSGGVDVLPFETYQIFNREAQAKRGEENRKKQSLQDEWNGLNLQIMGIKVQKDNKLDTIVKHFQQIHTGYLKYVTGQETTKTNTEYLDWIKGLDIDTTVRRLNNWKYELGKEYYTIKNIQGYSNSTITYTLPIMQFNAYNCGETARIPNSIVILPEYETADGTKIQPSENYLVIKDMNGAMNVSTTNLPISSSKDSKLFIRSDKNFYLVNTAELRKYQASKINDKVILKVEKVDVTNNKSLNELLKF